MELLNLFEDIKIENTTRLSSEDKKTMEEKQLRLDNTRADLIKYIEFYKNNQIRLYKSDDMYSECNYNRLIRNFIEKMLIPEIRDFISDVYSYFREKYNVRLETMEHSGEYSIEYRKAEAEANLKWFLEIDYKMLVDDIIEQLGGFSFEDKALEEITSRVKKQCKSWRNEQVTTVKSNIISINSFLYFDRWKIEWHKKYINGRVQDFSDMLKLLSHNESGIIENKFTEVEEYVNSYDNDCIGDYELNGSKVKSLKIFKNGKLQIKFNNGAEALYFANKYLGYNS